MKTSIILTITTFLMVAGIGASAQDFQGIATYQSSRKMDNFKLSGEGMSPEVQEQLKQQLMKQFQKEYTLTFNLSESLWKEAESLDGGPATATAGGMVIRAVSAGGGLTYMNSGENLYLQESEVFGKQFLVKDELEPREWQITSETKKIGEYTAYKALFNDIRESRSININSTNDTDSTSTTVRTDTIQVEAWFTPDIPVSKGPEEFWGLPGLILELKNGNVTYLCTELKINPADGVEIKRPSKGKEVTREELREEIDAKTMEMQQRFNGKGSMKMRVGGH